MLFSYLSMFLLFALRRATMPALARASRENGSIPYRIKKIFNFHSSSSSAQEINRSAMQKFILIR